MSMDHASPAAVDDVPQVAGTNVPYTPLVEPIVESVVAYDEVFPALPEMEMRTSPANKAPNPSGQWGSKMQSLKPTMITKMFHVPVDERRSLNLEDQESLTFFCSEVMHQTSAYIEISASKDRGLTVLVTGKEDAALKAKNMVQSRLQTHAHQTVKIPKDHHRFILGKKGQNLKDLEERTLAKINVPRVEDASEEIMITGTKEAIEKAKHEIQSISDEKAKKHQERIDIPKEYHIFITGAFQASINQLKLDTNTKIRVPPPSVNNTEISITGEKEDCLIAKERINRIYQEKKKSCQIVLMEVTKSQHKHIFGKAGSGIQEIFRDTGVAVEMPSPNDTSETIRLRGEQAKMGAALTLVNTKANSSINIEINAPGWLIKYIIGKKGANINEKTQDLDKIQVEFKDTLNKIHVEGPKEQVEEAQSRLLELIAELQAKLVLEEITVESQYHRHIVGKNGANISKIKKDTDVQIHVPSDDSNVIKIEGDPVNVAKAKKMILDMVQKLENETTKDLLIEQRFHRIFIGSRGEKIKEIRDKFSQVNIMFPDPGTKNDKVTIRGPREDVEGCYKHLCEMNKALTDTMAKVDVPIFKQFHKFIIGKGGLNIRKIREETGTNIDLPIEGSESDLIVITGKKENVLAAQERILAIQNNLNSIVQVDIIIPAKLHTSLIGTKGRLISSIKEDCGGVSIHFPQENSGSDKVTIRGYKDDVHKAKKILVDLSNDKQESSFTAEVKAKPEYIRFLIGKSGANIRKLRDKTGARIIFPHEKDDDRETIVIIGKKEEVSAAKKELEDTIKDLEKIAEIEFKVDPKHYRHFVSKRGEILNQIAQDFGNVKISFPRVKESSDIVKIKGAKDCVLGAKACIQEIVDELELYVTIECVIPQQHHRKVMGAKGSNVQKITQDYKVQIKFPEREREGNNGYANGEEAQMNGGLVQNEVGDKGGNKNTDTIYITGKRENCDEAYNALVELVPITEQLEVPYEFHGFIIGQKGKDVRDLMEKHSVNIMIPPASDCSELISIIGPPSNVKGAIEALKERVLQLEAEKQDKVLKGFQVQLEVDPKYHPKIIGKKGLVIQKIKKDFEVKVKFPERDDPNPSVLTITGYESKAALARDEILSIVNEYESLVTRDLTLDHRVFARLIGYKGSNIRKIMSQYSVDIRLPREQDSNSVVITGKEENVTNASDHLKGFEEEFMANIEEDEDTKRYLYIRGDRSEDNKRTSSRGTRAEFVVKGGPWEKAPLDTTNHTDFPSIGSGVEYPKPSQAWGPRR